MFKIELAVWQAIHKINKATAIDEESDELLMEAVASLREALDHSADTGKMVVPNGYALVSIDALKAWGKYDEVRNACQFSAEQAEQEPVAEILVDDKDVIVLWHKTARQLGHQAKLYAAPVEHVKQKPVAWYGKSKTGNILLSENCVDEDWKPLYAAPVRTKDLTEDEITVIPNFDGFPLGKQKRIDFARAVIAADREKNNER